MIKKERSKTLAQRLQKGSVIIKSKFDNKL